jgi:hypothetical protein
VCAPRGGRTFSTDTTPDTERATTAAMEDAVVWGEEPVNHHPGRRFTGQSECNRR